MLEISDMSDKDSLFYFQDNLKDCAKIKLDRRMFKHLMTPLPSRSCSPNTPLNLKTKSLTKAKVGERVVKIRATTAKIGGKKSLIATRTDKANRRAKKSH